MRFLTQWAAFAIMALLAVAQPTDTLAQQADPAFPLKLGASGTRHLVDQNGVPFFWAGDTAWSLIVQLSQQDVLTYLDDRKAKGFSVVMVNLIEHLYGSNAPANFYHDAPFIGTAFSSAPNEAYFQHADFVINAAAERGMLVLLAPLYLGFNCGTEGWCGEVQAASRTTMRQWGRYVGARYANFDNIVWMIGGDTNPSPVSRKVLEVVSGIREFDPTRLMTAHNQPESFAVDPWAGQSWLKVNNFYTYNEADHIYTISREAYARTPVMPFFQLESFYENEHGIGSLTLRKQAYGSLLNGAFGTMFGNCPIWHFGSTTGFCGLTNWRGALNQEGSVQMQYLHTLFRSRAWHLLIPDVGDSIITAGAGTFGDPDFATSARTSDGQTVIAYLPRERTVILDLTRVSGTGAKAWWLNPRTGTAALIGTFPTSGTQPFAPPGAGDWVLVLDDAAAGLPAPGNETLPPPPPPPAPPPPPPSTPPPPVITYLGNSDWGSTYDGQDNFSNLFRFTAPSNMSIDTIEVLVQSGSGGRIKMAVYSDQGGRAGSLLATSGEVISAVSGWNAASLSRSVSLASGTAYWLAFNTNSSTLRFAYMPGTGTTSWQTRSYSSAWPTLLGSTDGPIRENWAIRAYTAP
jgi:hypothetical protein